jgi:squalene-hopene/tetraprenyl-beta-curcumene cyclase
MKLFHQLTALLLLIAVCLPATALDDEHWKKANDSIDKGIAYLRAQQSEEGSWMPDVGPAVTGLALTAMLQQPDIGPDDPAAEKAIAYILANAQEDGSIRNGPDGILASYNTALCLSALAPVNNDPKVAEVIKKGQDFLRGTQWIVGMKDPQGKVIDEKHPYFGGFGYGKHGRPDISNTQMALQAMHDTGVDCEDPVFQRALTFLNRLQATEENDLFKEQLAELDGGFIYSPSVNKDAIGKPESKANQDQIDEAKAGRAVSGLRTYGSVTYAGFKSMLYADMDRDDKRVKAALDWISKNYTLEVNPGMPEEQKLQGLFYYYLTMGRALNAYGSSTIKIKVGEKTESRDWANDLIDVVVSQQHKDGWWANKETRWMESQPVLVTAYSIIALQNAID